jgi:hypothetical protein
MPCPRPVVGMRTTLNVANFVVPQRGNLCQPRPTAWVHGQSTNTRPTIQSPKPQRGALNSARGKISKTANLALSGLAPNCCPLNPGQRPGLTQVGPLGHKFAANKPHSTKSVPAFFPSWRPYKNLLCALRASVVNHCLSAPLRLCGENPAPPTVYRILPTVHNSRVMNTLLGSST